MTIIVEGQIVEVTYDDLLEYLKPDDYDHWQEEGKKAYKQALKDLIEAEWFDEDTMCEWLETESEFIEFMKKRKA